LVVILTSSLPAAADGSAAGVGVLGLLNEVQRALGA